MTEFTPAQHEAIRETFLIPDASSEEVLSDLHADGWELVRRRDGQQPVRIYTGESIRFEYVNHRGVEHEYVVEVEGEMKPHGLQRLAHGLSYAGRVLPPCKVSWQNEIRLRFALKGVQGGQLRDMCAQVGLDVVAIRRIRIGKVPLLKMPVGTWRYLPAGEKF